MALSLKRLVVIDVESTCWKGDQPKDQVSEIIEIGIAAVNLETEEITSESIIVKPTISTVSPFCTELTTLTQTEVDKGISFKEACDILRTQYKTKQAAWGSWGDYDRTMFDTQCKRMGVEYPFHKTHVNIKVMYALLNNLPVGIGVERATGREALQFTGTLHRGVDDAKNIAKMFLHIRRRYNK